MCCGHATPRQVNKGGRRKARDANIVIFCLGVLIESISYGDDCCDDGDHHCRHHHQISDVSFRLTACDVSHNDHVMLLSHAWEEIARTYTRTRIEDNVAMQTDWRVAAAAAVLPPFSLHDRLRNYYYYYYHLLAKRGACLSQKLPKINSCACACAWLCGYVTMTYTNVIIKSLLRVPFNPRHHRPWCYALIKINKKF